MCLKIGALVAGAARNDPATSISQELRPRSVNARSKVNETRLSVAGGGGKVQRLYSAADGYAGSSSLRPMTPATMRPTQAMRAMVLGSPSSAIPRIMAPAAPIPTQTA